MWREDYPLPRRQRMIRRQRVHPGLPGESTKLVILRCQCPFSEWHCRMLNPQPAGEDTDIHALHHEQVEEDGYHMPVAVHHEAC